MGNLPKGGKMSQFDVTFACGHKGVVHIYGKTKDRQRQADWMNTKLCDDCYKAKMDQRHPELIQKREQNLIAAKQQAEECDWPKLFGSAKQIAWAETIRASVLGAIKQMIEKSPSLASEPLKVQLAIRVYQLLVGRVSAHWWIENRDKSVMVLFHSELKVFLNGRTEQEALGDKSDEMPF